MEISENFLQNCIRSRGKCKYALLFCYFNNGEAFREYLNHFKGDTIVIIGPAEGIRVTDPSPLSPNFSNNDPWKLVASKEFGNQQDIIAIYSRNV